MPKTLFLSASSQKPYPVYCVEVLTILPLLASPPQPLCQTLDTRSLCAVLRSRVEPFERFELAAVAILICYTSFNPRLSYI